MIAQDALYDWLEGLIASAGTGTPLKNAVLFNNLRGGIGEAAGAKTIRVDTWSGKWTVTEETNREEQDVDFVIQCVVTPEAETTVLTELNQLDTAKALSHSMARTIFRAMAENGVPGVCLAFGDEWETGEPSFGAANRGATYFYGKVNP